MSLASIVGKTALGAGKGISRASTSGIGKSLIKDTAKYGLERSNDKHVSTAMNLGRQFGYKGSQTGKIMGRHGQLSAHKGVVDRSLSGGGPTLNKQSHDRLEILKMKMNRLKKEASIGRTLGNAALGTVAMTGTGMALTGGISAARNMLKKRKTEKVWDKLKKNNPRLAGNSGRENFEVLQQFSPDLATNEAVARSYLQRANQYNMTPHEFVKDLTGVQKSIDDSRNSFSADKYMAPGVNLANSMSKNSSLRDELDLLDPR